MRVIWALLLLAAGSAFAADEPLSVCDLAKDPAKYAGSVVHVRGTFQAGFEESMLWDARCEHESAWVEFSRGARAATSPRVRWRWDGAFSDPSDMCRAHRFDTSYTVDVTFVARFETGDRDRYGHLSGFDHQLSVLSIERVGRTSLSRSAPGPMEVPAAWELTVSCDDAARLP